MTSKKNRLVPEPANGLVDNDAPFWRGDTAERVIEERLKEARTKSSNRRKSLKPTRRSGRARASSSEGKDLRRELRRLERALSRRKTLAARQRLQMRIDQLRKELGL